MFKRCCSLIFCFLTLLYGELSGEPTQVMCSQSFSINPRLQKKTPQSPISLICREEKRFPWEPIHGDISRITPYFFMCKGRIDHPHVFSPQGQVIFDCTGPQYHSMFLKGGRAFVYPILLTLLNYIQQEMHAVVVITSGNRCPQHNCYVLQEARQRINKYMVGAQVDFYVRGYEEQPEKVLEVLKCFYAQQPPIYSQFQVFQEAENLPGYKNQEIAIHVFGSQERRNSDNSHSYSYLSIEVLRVGGCTVNVNRDWQEGCCFFY